MGDGDRLGAGDRGVRFDVGNGQAAVLGHREGGVQEGSPEQAEGGVERHDRLGHLRDGPGGDLRPVLLGSWRVQGEDVGEAGCGGLAGGERRAEVESLAYRGQQRGGAVLGVDEKKFVANLGASRGAWMTPVSE